jgi:hypothetical protein
VGAAAARALDYMPVENGAALTCRVRAADVSTNSTPLLRAILAIDEPEASDSNRAHG